MAKKRKAKPAARLASTQGRAKSTARTRADQGSQQRPQGREPREVLAAQSPQQGAQRREPREAQAVSAGQQAVKRVAKAKTDVMSRAAMATTRVKGDDAGQPAARVVGGDAASGTDGLRQRTRQSLDPPSAEELRDAAASLFFFAGR